MATLCSRCHRCSQPKGFQPQRAGYCLWAGSTEYGRGVHAGYRFCGVLLLVHESWGEPQVPFHICSFCAPSWHTERGAFLNCGALLWGNWGHGSCTTSENNGYLAGSLRNEENSLHLDVPALSKFLCLRLLGLLQTCSTFTSYCCSLPLLSGIPL